MSVAHDAVPLCSAIAANTDAAFGGAAVRRRIAYERLLLEAVKGDPTLFVRRDEAEAAWTWVDGVEDAWRRAAMKPVAYAPGSWGPPGLFEPEPEGG